MAASAQQGILEELRDRIRRIERRPPARPCFVTSGWPRVDALLPGGGFPRGAVSELTGGPASGKTAVALTAVAAAMGVHGLGAFVDGRGELYPPAAAALGVDLDRLLVIRPHLGVGAGDAARAGLWAAEALLASGAFEAVAIDVPLDARQPGRSAAGLEAMLRRVRAAAEKGGSVALWLRVSGGARMPSAVRLELSSGPAGWQVRRAFAQGSDDAPGGPAPLGAHHAA